MNILIIGNFKFQSWARSFKLGNWLDLYFATSLDEVNDHLLCGSFEGAFLDLDDTTLNSSGMIQAMTSTTNNMALVGLHTDIEVRKLVEFLNRAGTACFHKETERALLFANCASIVRLSQGLSDVVTTHSGVTLDLERKEVHVNGHLVPLTHREYQLFELLMIGQGKVLSLQKFINHIYCFDEAPEDKIFEVLICKIRKKLEGFGIPKTFIKTVRGEGYAISMGVGKSNALAA